MNLSEVREAIGNNAIVNDLGDGDVAMAFVGTEIRDDSMNVKAYIDGNPERLTVLMCHCMMANEEFLKLVANALSMYRVCHNLQATEKVDCEENV